MLKGSIKKDVSKSAVRLWFYPVAILIVPLFFLVIFEFSLRIFGYGFPTNFFVKKERGGQGVYLANPMVTQRYFGQRARLPLPEHFPAVKAEKTFRIFIFGESAVNGMEFRDFSFVRMLKEMLKDEYPDVNFEVINAGVTAVNSWAILPFVKETTGYQPDLFVIYCGNNEIFGPYGPGTVFSVLNKRALVKFRIWTTSLKMDQFFKNTASFLNHYFLKRKSLQWGGMGMFLGKQIFSGDRRIPETVGNYCKNIREMVAAAQRCGTKVVLCTVAANLKDFPPLGSVHRTGLLGWEIKKWESLYQQGIFLERRGLVSEAVQAYREAERTDNLYAELNFRLGRCYYRTGNYLKAKEYYSMARDNDTLRFRPDRAINQVLRHDYQNLLPGLGVKLVDVEETLSRVSPGGIIGRDLLYDHVHLNIDGHYLVASKIFEAVAATGWLPGVSSSRMAPGTLTKAECLARLGYTEMDRYNALKNTIQFVSQPPFINQLNHEDYVQTFKTQYGKYLKIQANDKDFKDFMNETIASYTAAFQLNPQNEDIPERLALAYASLGYFQNAIDLYLKILEVNPACVRVYEKLVDVYRAMGKPEKVVEWHNKSIAAGLTDSSVLLLRGGTANNFIGRYDAVISVFNRALGALERLPDSFCASFYNIRGIVYTHKGRLDKAIFDFNRVLAFSPDQADVYNNLGIVYYLKGEYDESRQNFRKAQALGYNVSHNLLQNLSISPIKVK